MLLSSMTPQRHRLRPQKAYKDLSESAKNRLAQLEER